jgi:hypothetical protein
MKRLVQTKNQEISKKKPYKKALLLFSFSFSFVALAKGVAVLILSLKTAYLTRTNSSNCSVTSST